MPLGAAAPEPPCTGTETGDPGTMGVWVATIELAAGDDWPASPAGGKPEPGEPALGEAIEPDSRPAGVGVAVTVT